MSYEEGGTIDVAVPSFNSTAGDRYASLKQLVSELREIDYMASDAADQFFRRLDNFTASDDITSQEWQMFMRLCKAQIPPSERGHWIIPSFLCAWMFRRRPVGGKRWYFPDGLHMRIAISACIRASEWQKGMRMYTCMGFSGLTGRAVATATTSGISAMAKGSRWREALGSIREHDPGMNRSGRTVISMFTQVDRWRKALGVFSRVLSVRRNPEETMLSKSRICRATIGVLQKRNPTKGLEVFRNMQRSRVHVGATMVLAAADCASAQNRWRKGLGFLAEMGPRRVKRGVDAQAAALQYTAQGRQWQRAIDGLGAVKGSRRRSNVLREAAVGSALARQWPASLRLLRRDSSGRLRAAVSYAFIQAGVVDKALDMAEDGDMQTYRHLVRSGARQMDAEWVSRVLRRMHSLSINDEEVRRECELLKASFHRRGLTGAAKIV
eukprot:Hpha_TRINITY_DN3916_c0_g1::TRINITY_DN3916_c0_g1_i1::g.18028::m.18028